MYVHHFKRRTSHIITTFIATLTIMTFMACGGENTDKQITATVDSFANTYYNWQFKEAMEYCTPESEKWLSFASTNVHQADIDILRQQTEGASHSINSITHTNDTSAVVSISVMGYLRMDTIGKAGQMIKEAIFNVPVKHRHGKWLVELSGLPRSERR